MTTMTRTRFLRHQGTHLASGGGGGISIDTGAFHISDSLFDTNYGMPEENGGGLLLVGVAGSIESTTFRGNTVSESGSGGGGLSINGGAEVDIQNCTFVSNTADGYGSAVYIDGGSSVTIQDSLMEANTILTSAGTIYAFEAASIAISNTVIRNNKVTGQFACGFYFAASDVTFEDTIIEANSIESALANYAAAGYLTQAAQVTFNRVDFIGNVGQADTVHMTSGANLACTDCRFIENEVETTGSVLMLTGGSTATFGSSTFVGNSGGLTAFSLSDEDDSLKIQASVIANTSNSVALIHDVTGDDFAVALETVTFGSNAGGPALASAGLVLVQNCEGLAAADVTNISLGSCANTLDYCFAAACADASIGTDCICLIDGVEQQMPIGCMESAQIVMAVPSSLELRLLATKPDNLMQEMVLSNPGFEPLEWELVVADIPDLNVTLTQGVIPAQDLVILPVHYASAATQARSAPYLGSITIRAVSGVCVCREQELTIDVHLTVSSDASATDSSVSILNAASVTAGDIAAENTASGTLNFEVNPVDSTGMAILNAGDIAYAATIEHPDGTAETICSVTYEATFSKHLGSCKLPLLVTGQFQLSVTDNAGLSVGSLPVTVTRCPVGAFLNSKGECQKCSGAFENPNALDCLTEGVTMEDLPIGGGNWRPSVKSEKVYPCLVSYACAGGNRTGDKLCALGHEGALCGSCTFPYFFLDTFEKRCKECTPGAKALVYGVGTLGCVLFLGFVAVASYYADRRMVAVKAHWAYRMVSPARLKILWALFQIVSSVESTLGLTFPPPFKDLLNMLSVVQLDLMYLPVGCVAEFSFFEKLIFSTISPMILIVVIALAYFVRAHFAADDVHVRQSIYAVHFKMGLLVAFIVYPTASKTIFEMLRPCLEFDASRPYLEADLGQVCGTPEYYTMFVYAIFMLLIITFGVPFTFAGLIHLNRHKIDPPAKDEMTKQRVRAQDESLAHLSFLFKEYRTPCLYMEPLELLRRAFMIGLVGFCGKHAPTKSAAGVLVALLFVFVYRELSPFSDRLNSLLADVSMWMTFLVFLCAFIIETRPFGYNDNALGALLLLFFLVVVGFAVWCAVHDGAEQAEIRQRQCELVFREVEADMDITELRADIQQLREKYEPEQVEKERKADEIEDLAGSSLSRQVSTKLAASASAKDPKTEISFFNVQYPCYVLSLNKLRDHERLPVHEDALRAEKLDVLTSSSLMPSSAFTYFVSQNWETFGETPHPDNTRNTKLKWLKNLPLHMKLPTTVTEVWVWWDLVCIPQRARAEQKKAIDSLCCYAQLCSRFIPLVRDVEEWKKKYDEDITHPAYPTPGALETYAARGWCRLEILCGLGMCLARARGWLVARAKSSFSCPPPPLRRPVTQHPRNSRPEAGAQALEICGFGSTTIRMTRASARC